MAKSKGKAKGKATVQSSLAIPAYPHLKKPLDHLGKQITVPGSAWGGRVAPDDLMSSINYTNALCKTSPLLTSLRKEGCHN